MRHRTGLAGGAVPARRPRIPAGGARTTYPHDKEQLEPLIGEVLDAILSEVPDRDDDSDVPIRTGRTVVYIRTQQGSP